MSINSVMISRILPEYTAEYIANVFWNRNIAQVSSVTLLPYLQDSILFQTAYVNIAAWTDSEIAYNFIERLKDTTKNARIVHHEDFWWPVKINTHNDGNISVGPYTTTFPETYFKRYDKIPEYNVDQVIARCEYLEKAIMVCDLLENETTSELKEVSRYCEELDYLEEQLRNYGNNRLASTERCIQYYGLPEQFMSVKDANARLDYLKTVVTKYRSLALSETLDEIKDEIEFLQDQLFSIITLKSQNVTLRPHQQSFVV